MSRLNVIIPSRDMQTLLSNVLISIEDDHIYITGSDMESTVRIRVPAENTIQGSVILKARTLSRLARELPPGKIHFTSATDKDSSQSDSEDDTPHIFVKGDSTISASYEMTSASKQQFPEINRIQSSNLFPVSSQLLGEMLRKTLYAISHEDARYVYNGICFIVGETNRITLVGTDGRRLSAITRALPKTINFETDGADVVIHAKAIQELEKLLDMNENIQLGIQQRDIFFTIGDAELSSRLLEGKFPDYKKVLPEESEDSIILVLDRGKIFDSLRQVMVMTEQPSFQIRLILKDTVLSLQANTPDMGKAIINIDIEKPNKDIEICFNASYLMDIIKNLDSKQIKIVIHDQDKPIVIHDCDDKDFVALIMPMRT